MTLAEWRALTLARALSDEQGVAQSTELPRPWCIGHGERHPTLGCRLLEEGLARYRRLADEAGIAYYHSQPRFHPPFTLRIHRHCSRRA